MPRRRARRSALASTLALALLAPAACRRRATLAAPRARSAVARRADTAFLERFAVTYRFSLGNPSGFQFTPGGETVLFLRAGPRSFVRQLYAWDVATGQERVLLTAEQVLRGAEESLSPEERARRERQRMTARGIASFQLSPDGASLLVPLSGRLFVVERASGSVRELPPLPGPASDPRFAPDGTRVAAVHDGDLYVLELAQPTPSHGAPDPRGAQGASAADGGAGGASTGLPADGASAGATNAATPANGAGANAATAVVSSNGASAANGANRVAGGGGAPGAAGGAWRRLTTRSGPSVTNGVAEFVAQEEMDRMEGYWFAPDGRSIAYQQTDESGVEQLAVFDPTHPEAAPERHAYPRAGHPNADVRVGVVSVNGGETTWVRWDRARYPYLARVAWPRNAPMTLLVQNREQTEEVLLTATPAGETRVLLTETDAVWLNLDAAMPRWLNDGSGFLWSTERGGQSQLELRGRDGALTRTLTPPEAGYRGLAAVDDAAGTLWFYGGSEPGETQLFRVALAGGAPTQLTHGHGEFGAAFSQHGGSYVLSSSTLHAPTRWTVHRGDGSEAGAVRSVAEDPGLEPRVEVVTVGPRDYRAAIVRPRGFDPARRYPVIVNVYGGPHARTVTARRDAYLLSQWFADQGFIVVSADGRGTPGRGRAWERALRGEAGDVPLADQVEALRALQAREPAMDPARVGIFGWSYGGYMAAFALLRRPDVYRAAVAGAPVTDWRDYDTHYTERYLGLPEREAAAYDRASLLTHAAELRRPLLLIHGTADDNVYFGHSVRFSDALFRAGRDHRFLPLTGFTHMVPDPTVAQRLYGTIAEHFIQNL